MNRNEINNIEKVADKIATFKEIYRDGQKLYGRIDGCVSPEDLIEWIINNSDLCDIAQEINKLSRKIK